MKKLIAVGIVLVAWSLFMQAFRLPITGSPDQILGAYWSPNKDAKIEIYVKGLQYCGKFIWLAHPRKDINNPVKELQGRELTGLELLTGFIWNNGVYSGGAIYDPETGKTYACKLTIEGNKLKVRGYVGISLFGRTEYFDRIK